MPGIAQYHFPQCVWKNGKRLLWNPIQKKALKNRPEERVRLRIIEALVEMGWSKNRISTEESINTQNEPRGRTDIICYDRNFSPKILVECKAENVPISPKVGEQAARYNRSVEAPYLLMSNGIADFWYRISNRKEVTRVKEIPDFLTPPEKPAEKPFSYWMQRGFAGGKAREELRNLLSRILNILWFNMEGETTFLSFSDSPTDLELAHYFKIFETGEEKTAVGFFNTDAGGTRLIAIFNRGGENAGVMETDFDLLISEETPNTILHTASGSKKIDIREYGLTYSEFSNEKSLPELPHSLDSLFNKFIK